MKIFGLSFSKEGVNADTNDPKDLIWSTEYNAFAIWKQEQVDLTFTDDGSHQKTFSIAHGLPFAPTFLAFYGSQGSHIRNTAPQSDVTYVYVDDTNIYFTLNNLYNGLSTFTLSVYYYIFADAAKVSNTQTVAPVVNKYGLKIVKPLKDISSQYLEDLIFSTDYPPLKLQDIKTVSAHVDFTTTTIPHGLPFTPAFLPMIVEPSFPNGLTYIPYTDPDTLIEFVAWADQTNIYIKADNSLTGGSADVIYKVIIFADRAEA